jgi:ABC-2 type transport system permease protein
MSASTTTRPFAPHRIRSLGRAELLLLRRNRMALFSTLGMPLLFVGVLAGAGLDQDGRSTGVTLVTSMLGFVLLAAVYYNRVSAYVARREEQVLRRLRIGELTDAEILAGVASPSVAVALTQCALFTVGGAVLFDLPAPVNALLLLLAVLGGVAVFVLLAAVSSAFTRTTELAQITTLPILIGCLLGSGLMLPLDELPGPVATALRALPLTPVLDLFRLGWTGTVGPAAPADFLGTFGPAALPAGILLAWVVLGTVAVRRWFRWDPRR